MFTPPNFLEDAGCLNLLFEALEGFFEWFPIFNDHFGHASVTSSQLYLNALPGFSGVTARIVRAGRHKASLKDHQAIAAKSQLTVQDSFRRLFPLR